MFVCLCWGRARSSISARKLPPFFRWRCSGFALSPVVRGLRRVGAEIFLPWRAPSSSRWRSSAASATSSPRSRVAGRRPAEIPVDAAHEKDRRLRLSLSSGGPSVLASPPCWADWLAICSGSARPMRQPATCRRRQPIDRPPGRDGGNISEAAGFADDLFRSRCPVRRLHAGAAEFRNQVDPAHGFRRPAADDRGAGRCRPAVGATCCSPNNIPWCRLVCALTIRMRVGADRLAGSVPVGRAGRRTAVCALRRGNGRRRRADAAGLRSRSGLDDFWLYPGLFLVLDPCSAKPSEPSCSAKVPACRHSPFSSRRRFGRSCGAARSRALDAADDRSRRPRAALCQPPQFLDVMFSDRPALEPYETLYQRMLAGDRSSAPAGEGIPCATGTCLPYCDEIALPALRRPAHVDIVSGLMEERRATLLHSFETLLTDLAPERPSDDHSFPQGVSALLLHSDDPLDEPAARMLRSHRGSRGAPPSCPWRMRGRKRRSDQAFEQGSSLLFEPLSAQHMRAASRAVRRLAPGADVMICIWQEAGRRRSRNCCGSFACAILRPGWPTHCSGHRYCRPGQAGQGKRPGLFRHPLGPALP